MTTTRSASPPTPAAPSASRPLAGPASTTNVPRAAATASQVNKVIVSTHNWVEAVYKAVFGTSYALPTKKGDVALLGLRTTHTKSAAGLGSSDARVSSRETALGTEAGATSVQGDTGDYQDLLYVAQATEDAHDLQQVDVFECVIDATKSTALELMSSTWPEDVAQARKQSDDTLSGPSYLSNVASVGASDWAPVAAWALPDLVEGKPLTARLAPYLELHSGQHTALRVDVPGKPNVRPEDVVPRAESAHDAWWAGYKKGTVTNGDQFYKDIGQPDYGAWCGAFASAMLSAAGFHTYVYWLAPTGAAAFAGGAWGQYFTCDQHDATESEPGDLAYFSWAGMTGQVEHTGMIVDVSADPDSFYTIEGNAHDPGVVFPAASEVASPVGSYQPAGGVRPRGSELVAFGRPRYAPIIRWGGDDSHPDKRSRVGQTVLRHHYYKANQPPFTPDPAAARYKAFLALVKGSSPNIPYLIVSTAYVRTHEEWAALVTDGMSLEQRVALVIKQDKLAPAPGLGVEGHFLPSFINVSDAQDLAKKYAGRTASGVTAARRAQLERRYAEYKATVFALKGVPVRK